MTNCKNCNTPVIDHFCGNCGQPVQLKRVDSHYILHEIQHILHFEKGILYTIKELLIRPGQNIREFIADNRSRLVKPILFIIVTSFIYTLINHFFHIEEYVDYSAAKNSATSFIFHWIQNNYGYANIIMGVFIAFWLKLFFRKYDYNFFEILIMLCFVMGIGMLIFSVSALFEGLTKLNSMMVSGIICTSYFTWSIGQFFNKKKTVSYIKALISYILGMITFSISAMLLGLLIDSLI